MIEGDTIPAQLFKTPEFASPVSCDAAAAAVKPDARGVWAGLRRECGARAI
jgi:hypothetical protein